MAVAQNFNEGPKSIPHSRVLQNLYTLADHGTTGAVTDQDPKEFDLDALSQYHEGLLLFQTTSLNGQGGTPTSPGAAVTFTLDYAYSTVKLNNVGDAPTVLDGVKSSLVHTFPDTALVASVQATETLTFTGQPLDTETVTLGSTVYTFKTTPASAYDVQISTVDVDQSVMNLIDAVNATGLRTGAYFAGTLVHPTVSAAQGAGDTVTITALLAGTAGNSLASTETLTNGSFGAATLSGGLATGALVSQTTAVEVFKGRYLYTWYDRDAYAANALTDVQIDVVRV